MRVHEAAKHYGVSNEDIVRILSNAGYEVSSHMATVSYEMASILERRFKPPKPKTKAKRKTAKKAKPPEGESAEKKAKAKTKAKAKAKVKADVKPKAKATAKSKAKVKEKAKPEAEAEPVPKVVPSPAEPPVAAPREKEKADEKPTPVKKEKVAARPAPTPPAPKVVAPAARSKPAPKPAPAAEKPPRRPPAPAKKMVQPAPRTPQARKPAAPRKKLVQTEAQQKAVRESVRRTLAKIETTRRTKRRKGKSRDEFPAEAQPVRVVEGTTVRELASTLKVDPSEIITICMELGVPVTINQILEKDTIELVSERLDKAVHLVADEVEELLQPESHIEPKRLKPRAPIVTVMGHVDHGKTSILDYIRKARVAAGEAGGITQHVGAYEVETPQGNITFIDTPGHEAFTAMRARGAQVTDIVVLVVAADDGVMPQTMEAINHAKAASVPIIVAVNKMDLPSAKSAQIKQQLSDRGVVVEEYGGDVVCVEVSAKTGQGIDKLLEMILLQAEILELKADREASAVGTAVEVKKEEGRGILCTVLVTQGTLRVGDVFVIGAQYGKVRALLDYRGRSVKEVGPSKPVVVLGCNGLPEAGDKLTVVRSEREARDLSLRRQHTLKDRERRTGKKLTLEELYTQIQQGDLKELRLIIKGDTNGSVEALTQSLTKLSNDEVVVKVIHSGVGVIGESDVLLAASSDALIIGFNVRVSSGGQELAEREKVEIKNYSIIYECIEDVDAAMKGLLEPERIERVIGRAEVRKVFKISKLGTIAGSFVTEGSITRNASARVVRGGEVIFEGKISSLKRFQDDVREVQKDFECGIGITNFADLQEGDVVEAFLVEEKARVGWTS